MAKAKRGDKLSQYINIYVKRGSGYGVKPETTLNRKHVKLYVLNGWTVTYQNKPSQTLFYQ